MGEGMAIDSGNRDTLKNAQDFIGEALLKQAAEQNINVTDYMWDQRSEDKTSDIHYLAVYVEGIRFPVSFQLHELLTDYGSRKWQLMIRKKLEDFLNGCKTIGDYREDLIRGTRIGELEKEARSSVQASGADALQDVLKNIHDLRLLEGKVLGELRNAEERFKIIVEDLSIGVYYSDVLGKFLYGNKRAEEICGYKREELIGKNYFDLNLLDKKELAKAGQLLALNMMGVATGPDLFKLRRKDRSFVFVEIITQMMNFGGKKVVMGLVQDVTNRVELQQWLKINQERYDLATRSATVGVWDWNVQTGEFYLDKNVKAILGYEDQDIPNDLKIWSEHIHPEDKDVTMNRAQEHLDGKTPEYTCEHRMLHKDGSVRWMLTRGKAFRDRKGNAVRMVGTDMDITERKRIEEERERLIGELKEANQKIKDLSGIIPICAHCKKVRDDKGYWHQVEVFIRDHSELDFSHSVCPDCASEFYDHI
jgi:PAS domain S-box-containing protein